MENAALISFLGIADGAPGCIFGRWLADHMGRCHATTLLMVVSGMSALLIGLFFNGPSWLFITIALIWGFTAVADSAHFSAVVTELSDRSMVGSALAFKMGVGFAITIFVLVVTSLSGAFGQLVLGFRDTCTWPISWSLINAVDTTRRAVSVTC